MQTTHPRALEVTLEMINAETQLPAALRFRPAGDDL
jgi:hypothetical protein